MRRLYALFILLCSIAAAQAQTSESVMVDGATTSKFVTGLKVDGDNVTLTYKDGTTESTDMSSVSIDLAYKATLGSTEADNDANSSTISNFGGKTLDVSVSRDLAAGQWASICVPFDMTSEQVQTAFGSGAKLAVFDSASGENINFKTIGEITAGVPYVINPSIAVASFTASDVLLKNITKGAEYEAGDWTFVGTIASASLTGNNKDVDNDQKLKDITVALPLHAYLKGAENATAKTFSIDGVTTGIMQIVNGEAKVAQTGVYNLRGQYLGNSVKGLPKGLYIINGKKQIVR